jgi:hypothetical protein
MKKSTEEEKKDEEEENEEEENDEKIEDIEILRQRLRKLRKQNATLKTKLKRKTLDCRSLLSSLLLLLGADETYLPSSSPRFFFLFLFLFLFLFFFFLFLFPAF